MGAQNNFWMFPSNMNVKSCMIVFASILLLVHISSAKKLKEANEENCEVCVKFLSKFIDSLDSDTKSTPAKVEEAFRKTCKTAKKDDNRLCYYIGATEDAATSIVGELTKPVSWGVPANKVCLKLYKKDEQICELKYEKQIDLSNVNLKKLKVKDLKNILSDWDEQCRGCTEKTDYVKRVEELMEKHAPESYAARQKKQEL